MSVLCCLLSVNIFRSTQLCLVDLLRTFFHTWCTKSREEYYHIPINVSSIFLNIFCHHRGLCRFFFTHCCIPSCRAVWITFKTQFTSVFPFLIIKCSTVFTGREQKIGISVIFSNRLSAAYFQHVLFQVSIWRHASLKYFSRDLHDIKYKLKCYINLVTL